MTLTSKPLAVMIVVLMFGGIFFSDVMGWWQTKNSRQAGRFGQGQFAGQANPADIRGSYTFGDVEANFDVPVAVLAQAFGVDPAGADTFRLNGLETLYANYEFEVGTESVKLFVAFYLGLPYDLSEAIYLPESAAVILATRNLDADRQAYLAAHTVPSLEGALSVPLVPAEGEHGSSTERVIRGRTTFGELLQWGLTQAQIEAVLGVEMPSNPAVVIRDYCTEKGLSYGQVKAGLQAELDG